MKKVDALIVEMRAYFAKNNIAGVYYGCSGGVDSAVLRAILTRCMSIQQLPVIFSFDGKTIPMNAIYAGGMTLIEDLSKIANDIKGDAGHNIRYQRMYSKLFELAQIESGRTGKTFITAGSCNKTELLAAWYGMNSDMMVDILPLKHFTKAEIYEAADFLDVPRPIIEAAPDGQIPSGETDEQALGADYAFLDDFANAVESEGVDKAMELLDTASRHMKFYLHVSKNKRKLHHGRAILQVEQFKL